MKIGIYEVEPRAEGTIEGGFCGYAFITWDDGGTHSETKIIFDRVLPSLGEAVEHATEKVNGWAAAGHVPVQHRP